MAVDFEMLKVFVVFKQGRIKTSKKSNSSYTLTHYDNNYNLQRIQVLFIKEHHIILLTRWKVRETCYCLHDCRYKPKCPQVNQKTKLAMSPRNWKVQSSHLCTKTKHTQVLCNPFSTSHRLCGL